MAENITIPEGGHIDTFMQAASKTAARAAIDAADVNHTHKLEDLSDVTIKGSELDADHEKIAFLTHAVFDVALYGAKADGVTDDTIAIQAALNAAEANGGGTVRLMAGKHLISMAASPHPNCCVLVPSNTNLQGMGRAVTTVTRPDAERSTNGVLICNKNYDTIGGYNAAKNVTYSHFRIEDEELPNQGFRNLGDLIGIGHADGVLVEWMYFGHHDQHALDICQSRNVTVRYNESFNNRNVPQCATYQIDAGLVWGIVSEGLGCENIHIHNNKGVNNNAIYGCVHFHSAVHAKNVLIENNDFSGAVKGGLNVIGADNTCSFENVIIRNNKLTGGHAQCRVVNLFVNDKPMSNVAVYANEIEGLYRIGVWLGGHQTMTTDNIATRKNLFIRDNIFDLSDNVGLGGFPINLASIMSAENGQISGNIARVGAYTTTGVLGWFAGSFNVKSLICRDNELETGVANHVSSLRHTVVDVTALTSNNVASSTSITGNLVSANSQTSDKWIQVTGASSLSKGQVADNLWAVNATINEDVPANWTQTNTSNNSTAVAWSRLDQSGVVYLISGGFGENRSGHCYLAAGNSSANTSASVQLLRTLPQTSGQGIRPHITPLVLEFLVRDGTGSAYPDVNSWIVMGSHYTAPEPPSNTVRGVAIRHHGGNVYIVSSDGVTMNSSPAVGKVTSAYTTYIEYRVEVDGQTARLFRAVDGVTNWTLIATVPHPTQNFTYPNTYFGLSAIINYTHGSGSGGGNRYLQIYDSKCALVNPSFL